MILGFAHITRNETPWAAIGRELPNAPEKWPLMQHHATSHWLRVSEVASGVPEEVAAYNTGNVTQPARLVVVDGEIGLRVRDFGAETGFFCGGLGFEFGDGKYGAVMRLTSPLRNWEVGILPWVDLGAPIDPPLDIAGYAALAFYSSDVEADRDHLLKHGGRTPTEPFRVKLDREMKIVMLRSPEGTIIELIQVMP
jgi:hypothetical protein